MLFRIGYFVINQVFFLSMAKEKLYVGQFMEAVKGWFYRFFGFVGLIVLLWLAVEEIQLYHGIP